MKKKAFKVVAVALVGAMAVACLGLTACGGQSSNDKKADASYTLVSNGTLKVATSPDYKPMEYMEGSDITGFDIALVKEVATRLGLKADVQNQAFDSLVTQVAGGSEFDCAISSITISDERKETVSFTDPYYDSNLAIVTLKNSGITSRDQLADAEIAAQSGSSGEDWAKENLKGAKYTPFQETPDALAALRAGKVKAVIYDEPVAQNHVAGEYNDCTILETIPTGEQYGIIVNKKNEALAKAINEQLKAMQSDGTMDKLKKQYIG